MTNLRSHFGPPLSFRPVTPERISHTYLFEILFCSYSVLIFEVYHPKGWNEDDVHDIFSQAEDLSQSGTAKELSD